MIYDLRRLRLRRIDRTDSPHPAISAHRRRAGVALAYHRTQARVLGSVLSTTLDGESTTRLREALAIYDREVDRAWRAQALAA